MDGSRRVDGMQWHWRLAEVRIKSDGFEEERMHVNGY